MVRLLPAVAAAVLALEFGATPIKADPYFLGVDLDLYPPPLTSPPPLITAPRVEYGCKRFWRCDTNVCEWRRGCWGVNGYVETPYYTPAYARRQYETYGLPKDGPVTVAPAPGILTGPAPGVAVVRPPPVVIAPTVVVDQPPVVVPPAVAVAPAPDVVVAPRKRPRKPPLDPRDK